MYFDAYMMRDQAHDAFRVGGRDAAASIFEASRQTIDPQTAIGVQHHLDDAGIFQIGRDRRPQGGAQHARAAGESFRSQGNCRHSNPVSSPHSEAHVSAGLIRKSRKWDSATTEMRPAGSGIERQVAGMVGGPGNADALVTEYAWFRVEVELINCAGGPMNLAFATARGCGQRPTEGAAGGDAF
jgi:hypothetical protein